LGGGGERRGKPIMAFCRLDDQPIRVRSRITEPDYVIVQDATILKEVDVQKGLKADGLVLINTDKDLSSLGLKTNNVLATSAEKLARRILGRPIINTALLGTFAGVSGELSLESVLKAVRSKFPGELGEKNAQIVAESYRQVQKEES
jgi:pyruvate ferredoxin oxidoreductase gamma subunit